MRIGDTHVGHIDLVELGLASDLAERTYIDALGLHVESEVGHAAVFTHVWIGPGDQHAPVGNVCQRVPDLLTVDDPLIAVFERFSAKASEVRTSARF